MYIYEYFNYIFTVIDYSPHTYHMLWCLCILYIISKYLFVGALIIYYCDLFDGFCIIQ